MDTPSFSDIPDLQSLEKLANQFFKSVPNSESNLPINENAISESYTALDSKPEFPQNFSKSSFSNPLEFSNNLPQSVAGSGKSPSVNDHQNDFSIIDPQTSLPDPHFYDGKIPKSVAGGGKSPSLVSNSGGRIETPSKERAGVTPFASPYTGLPFESIHSHDKDLQEALGQIYSYVPTSQIPVDLPVGSSDASYYFLAHPNPFHALDNIHVGSFQQSRATHGITSFVKPPFDMNLVKADFPILKEKVNGKPLIWLDNAATTQKPKLVMDRINYFYEHENSNIHRAAHELAARATDAYESARQKIQHFINAKSINEIIFVRGTTEGINLIAQSWGDQNLKEGDEIILSHLEHHANIVPWQLLAAKKGLKLRVIPVDDDGQIILEEYGKLLNTKTKLVSFTHVSNALGTVTPAKAIIDMAHAQGAKVVLDGAQSVSHMRVDVQHLNPDFFVFSGHKVFGPTGIGAVYGKEHILNETQPWQGGGNMIKDVTFEHTEYHNAPGRFEAGTGNIADAVGLGAALDYVGKIGIDFINQYEHALLVYATHLLKQVPGLKLIGTAHDKASVLSFVLDGYSNDEVGKALNQEAIAVRTGHHCAQPILRRFGLESTVRPSLAFYNTCGDVDVLVSTLHRLAETKKR
ncbi:MAG: family 2A encapsulin nanocompartment cargo protein cysteine desulfurase [Cytophagales bacterium]|nr:family 2A encapsulin nanocompartment cargo protein cysteine desulfurase [Cytophagales bacterium]